MKEIKIFEMFSGYGGASFALKKAMMPFECVGYSEIDKYAIQCYDTNHKGIKNFGDCTKINPLDLPDFDLLTGGFPCQAFSQAGKQQGELDTRGTLFNEIIRIAEVKQPKYMLLENVKGLTQEKFKNTFDKILSELKRIGYNVRWKVLNSKEYGIPQSRNRVFFYCYRQDVIEGFDFQWPEKEELSVFVKDLLEDNVDEKYDLSEKQINRILESEDIKKKFSVLNSEVAITETARQYANWKGNFLIEDPKSKLLYKEVIPCLRSGIGSGNKLNYIQFDMSGKGYKSQHDRVYSAKGVMCTLSTNKVNIFIGNKEIMNCVSPCFGRQGSSKEFTASNKKVALSCYQFRRLTPKECFRLMGFVNDEINLNGISDTQLYKLAGNGWEINLISKIFKEMFKYE